MSMFVEHEKAIEEFRSGKRDELSRIRAKHDEELRNVSATAAAFIKKHSGAGTDWCGPLSIIAFAVDSRLIADAAGNTPELKLIARESGRFVEEQIIKKRFTSSPENLDKNPCGF